MENKFCQGKNPEETREMEMYFNALSPYIQENIRQSGVCFSSSAELQACAENIMDLQ